MSPSSPASKPARRRGFSVPWLVIALTVVLAVLTAAYVFWSARWRSASAAAPTTCTAESSEFVHELNEKGTIESGNNVEIRCEVKSNNMSGTTILEIVPEGKMVEKDEVLVKLDSSVLESDLIKQQMAVSNAKAELIKAETAVEMAVQAKDEYLEEEGGEDLGKLDEPAVREPGLAAPRLKEGTFVQQQRAAQSEVFVAQENLRRAEEYARYSERLAAKGYVTALQLEADRFAVQKAKKDLEVAQIKLKVLEGYTRQKTLTQLKSDIETTRAKREAQIDSHRLECEKLAIIEDQIRKCVIRAPCAGQVVYHNVTNVWNGNKDTSIEAGASARERQVLIDLPDRDRMQVKAKINESKIALVTYGMRAMIRLDALPDVELDGTVVKVDEFPVPTNRMTAAVREYETTIRIHKSHASLRTGLTAQARIQVQRIAKAVQVPVQAILEHNDRHYCVFWKDGKAEARPVTIGSTNDKFVVVREGLTEGEQVVQNAAAFRDQLTLPDLPLVERSPAMMASAETAAPVERLAKAERSERPGRNEAGTRPNRRERGRAGGEVAPRADQVFAQFEKGTGRVKLTEVPEKARLLLGKSDANGDGIVERAEVGATVAHVSTRGASVPPAPGTPR